MPSISIKAIVLIHWMLAIWTLSTPWTPPSYVWCNITVLAVGIWAIADRQSVDALIMFIVMILISIIVDIVVISTAFNAAVTISLYRFSTGMCILNLILKPVSVILLYQMYRDRGGEYNINFGSRPSEYQNFLDKDVEEATPRDTENEPTSSSPILGT